MQVTFSTQVCGAESPLWRSPNAFLILCGTIILSEINQYRDNPGSACILTQLTLSPGTPGRFVVRAEVEYGVTAVVIDRGRVHSFHE